VQTDIAVRMGGLTGGRTDGIFYRAAHDGQFRLGSIWHPHTQMDPLALHRLLQVLPPRYM
jgi:hypothetical protein